MGKKKTIDKTKKKTDKNSNSRVEQKVVKKKRLHLEVFAILLLVLGVLLVVSTLIEQNNLFAGFFVKRLYSISFGKYVSLLIPANLISLALILIFKKKRNFADYRFVIILIALALVIDGYIGVYNHSLPISEKFFEANSYSPYIGTMGYLFTNYLKDYLGIMGSYTLLTGLLLILTIYAFNFHFSEMIFFFSYPFLLIARILYRLFGKIIKKRIKAKYAKELQSSNETSWDEKPKEVQREIDFRPQISSNDEDDLEPELKESQVAQKKPKKEANKTKNNKDIQIEKPVVEKEVEYKTSKEKELNYIPPSIELLNDIKQKISLLEKEEQLRENANALEQSLKEFNVDGVVAKINPGPVITQYEIKLAKGVKVARIASLERDLAMALKARSIRIVAPIPGKGTVGIEIPNQHPSIVSLKSIINSEKFVKHKSKLAIALGKTISGENYVLDLQKTPHLLIAGATGSGKSVCINGLIVSILYRANPSEVQFCMIDPKKVELSPYSKLVRHHLLQIDGIDSPVVTDSKDAVRLLEALVEEMDRRYDILQRVGARNLEEYNSLLEDGEIDYDSETGEEFKKMAYIVCIVDEYGDLMMTSGKEVEGPICRLAQLARAIGIHMVLATQRPSAKVVTGLIKANFPSRIAFRVMSYIDSRTILDSKGAESLIGKGDMLIIPPGSSEMIRIQNALVETKEINRIVAHISSQATNFEKIRIEAKPLQEEMSDFGEIMDEKRDALYEDAKRMVIQSQVASVSMLQRSLSVGYARAGKIIDQLERDGVVGPHVGSKSREVLVQDYD